ncbi:hypothetical protein HKD37_11G032068 [Glycine soja]
MEDFMAQMAWPGFQPFPIRGGEASTAQESQLEPEDTPEDTPGATPLEATEEGDVTEDTDYAADMAAVQST